MSDLERDLLFLALAIIAGFVLGRATLSQLKSPKVKEEGVHLQSLIDWFNLQDDTDIQKIIESLEVSPDTVETHMALAVMYRKRGEFSKSLAIHQNLFGRTTIGPPLSLEVQFELACDYLDLGMVARAERLFSALINNNTNLKYRALDKLLHIYESENDWGKCIDTGEKFGRKIRPTQKQALSHYYCELALQSLEDKHYASTESHLKKAIYHNVENTRAWLIKAKMESKRGRHALAFRYCKKAAIKNPEFISEVLGPAFDYADQANIVDQYDKWIKQLSQFYTIPSLQLAATYLAYRRNPEASLQDYMKLQSTPPSRKVVMQLLTWQQSNQVSDDNESLLLKWMSDLVKNDSTYQCQQCGYETIRHNWHCPQCRHWETAHDKEDHAILAKLTKRQF